jgi:hypothetical protein
VDPKLVWSIILAGRPSRIDLSPVAPLAAGLVPGE